MTATDARMQRPHAIEIAKAFVAEIEPYTDQLIVAGSLRRRLALIGDIESCAVPRIETIREVTRDLFDVVTVETPVDTLDAHLNRLLAEGEVQQRPRSDGAIFWGPRAKYLTFRGARIDLFCAVNDWRSAPPPKAEPERFGWILLLRTGPAAFSRQLVVPVRDDRGRPGRTKDRRPGLLPEHIRPKDGWLTYRTSGERIPTPDEKSVFELFGLPYREPWERI